MAGVTGLEPAASGVTGQRSNQLSYTPMGPSLSVTGCLKPLRAGVKQEQASKQRLILVIPDREISTHLREGIIKEITGVIIPFFLQFLTYETDWLELVSEV